jgi:phosphohistidine phosphatase SixA
MTVRRTFLAVVLTLALVHAVTGLAHATRWAAPSGAVILLRHANAPGVGDPENFRLGDCSTQRNLDSAGRDQAKEIGQRLRADGIKVRKVLSSQWCRTLETAQLAFPGAALTQAPAFNSFFGQPQRDSTQTALALVELQQWKGPGVMLVVTHQVNITALTGIVPRPGEGVVVKPSGGTLTVLGRLVP